MLVHVKLEPPLGPADSVVASALMISIPHTLLQRATLIVLALYVGAFLGQTLCVLHTSHVESLMGSGMDGSAAHASSSMATHASSSMMTHTWASMATHPSLATAVHAPSSMAALNPSQHGEHLGAPGPDHTGVCAAVSCASGLTATPDDDLGLMNQVSHAHVAYLGGTMPPDAEMVPPPPRLG